MMGFSPEALPVLLGTCVVPAVLEDAGVTTPEGVRRFYASDVYRMLADPHTGVWHLSSRTLADMYLDELVNGVAEIPEEQS